MERELQINYRILLREPLIAKSQHKENKKKVKVSFIRAVAKKEEIKLDKNQTKPTCKLYELEHYICFCPMLKDESIIEKLQNENICTRCLRKPCKEEYCGKYIKMGEEKSSDCWEDCRDAEGKPLSYLVCGCRNETPVDVKSNRVSSIKKFGNAICLTEKIEIQQGN